MERKRGIDNRTPILWEDKSKADIYNMKFAIKKIKSTTDHTDAGYARKTHT